MLHACNEKREMTHDGRSRTTKSRKIRTLRKRKPRHTWEYWKNDTIRQVEMKEKIKKEYHLRTKKLFKAKLYRTNLVKGINTWDVPLVRYSGLFLKWTRKELKQMNLRTRKLMNMHMALHPVERLHVNKKRGRKRTWQHWRQCWRTDITTQRLHRKAPRKTDCSHQKQYKRTRGPVEWQYPEKEVGRKKTNSMDVLSD